MPSSLDPLASMSRCFRVPASKRRRRDRTQTRATSAVHTSHHSRAMTLSAAAAGPGVVAAQHSALLGNLIKVAVLVMTALGGKVVKTGTYSRPAVAGGTTSVTHKIRGGLTIEGVRNTAAAAALKSSGDMICLLPAAASMTTEVLLCPSTCQEFNLACNDIPS